MSTNFVIPVTATIKEAWQKTHGVKASFWAALALVFLIMLGAGIIQTLLRKILPGIDFIISILVILLNFTFQCGLIYMGIKRAFESPINYKMMFYCFDNNVIWRVIGTYLLQSVIIFIAPFIILTLGSLFHSLHSAIIDVLFTLFAIAAWLFVIYLSIRLMLSLPLAIDKGTGPVTSLKLSYQATNNNVWPLIGIMILQVLIILVSMIPLGLGLIWTLPFALINYGVVYKQLSVNIA